jgi:hypothetical protein
MRIFEISDFDSNYVNNTWNQSSGNGSFAFINDNNYYWETEGEATNGTTSFLQASLEDLQTSTIDSLFILESNITDLAIYLDTGSGLVLFTDYAAIDSEDGKSHYYKLNSEQTITGLKVEGSITNPANEEKKINRVLAFKQLARIENPAEINPTKNRKQKINKLLNGKSDIINLGSSFDIDVKLKNHLTEQDNDAIEFLSDRDFEFWIWIQDEKEDRFKLFKQEPFRFQDLKKVAVKGKTSPNYKNGYWSSLDVSYKLIEVN